MTTITLTDIETKKTKTVTAPLSVPECIEVYSNITKGRIVGNKIKAIIENRFVEIEFTN